MQEIVGKEKKMSLSLNATIKEKTQLTATQVEALDPYALMAVLGKRVIHPGGRRSTDELFQRADFQAGQQVLDVGCGVGTTATQIAAASALTLPPSTFLT
jgi:2-polyprenyl-3-methyl-5-hydroxy-6-metoxy-1,4-benzoquinol methylase